MVATTLAKTFCGSSFTQKEADRLEAALATGSRVEVTIDGVRFTAHCEVGAFVLIDEVARAAGRRWSAVVHEG